MAKQSPVQADLRGRRCIVTGANTGMGKVTAEALAGFGAEVILACRSTERGEAAKRDIVAANKNAAITVLPLDLSSMESIRSFASEVRKRAPTLHLLVNNAAGWWADRRQSVDGIELQWATNVLGPYLLTELLLPSLEAGGRDNPSRQARIVNVASTAAGGLNLDDVQTTKGSYSGVKVYSATKQANRMLTWALADRLKGKPVTANALSPGLVNTELNRNAQGFFKVVFSMTKAFARTAAQGADTTIWLAASPDVEGKTGIFWDTRKEIACKFRIPDQYQRLEKICADLAQKRSAAA